MLSCIINLNSRSPTGNYWCGIEYFYFQWAHGQEPRLYHECGYNMHLLKSTQTQRRQTDRFSIAVLRSRQHMRRSVERSRTTDYFRQNAGNGPLISFMKSMERYLENRYTVSGDEHRNRKFTACFIIYILLPGKELHSVFLPWAERAVYNGHVFWDADYGCSGLLVLHRSGKIHIEYRMNAWCCKKKCILHGYKVRYVFPGNLLPVVWKNPVWALSGPFWTSHYSLCGISRLGIIIVYADKVWLRGKGLAIISATADFWASRVEENGPGHYDIRMW